MPSCAALGCSNHNNTKKKTVGVTFHRFPKNAEESLKWTVAMNRPNWKPSVHSILCSAHFKPQDFETSSLRVCLSKGAVPSIFDSLSDHAQQKSRKVKRNLLELPNGTLVVKEDKSVDMLECTRRVLNSCRKKLRNERKRTARLSKKVTSLTEELNELKAQHSIAKQNSDKLSRLSGTSASILNRDVLKGENPNFKDMYDEKLRSFAFTLNFLSPKAYDFVRETLQNNLPHRRTLARWYSNASNNKSESDSNELVSIDATFET